MVDQDIRDHFMVMEVFHGGEVIVGIYERRMMCEDIKKLNENL